MDTMIAGNNRPVISFSEPVSSAACIDLIDRIRSLKEDYFYAEVQLRLSSPGGEVMALEYFVEAASELRGGDFRIDCHAVTRVASAACVMLSLGDERTSHPKAALLYHTGRVAGVDGALTARGAATIADALGSVDSEIVGLLAERAARSPCPAGDTPREQFTANDWRVIGRLSGSARRPDTALRRFRKRVAEAFDGGPDGLRTLYADFCALDAPISAHLALEFGLLDAVGDGEPEAAAQADDTGLTIPQWDMLYPQGRVPRAALTRHTLILGETGSGKTVSGILPVLSAILEGDAPVCALVIDPKCELYPAIKRMAGPGVQVRLLRPGVDSLDLMSGSRSVAEDIAASRWLTAARKMLARASGFAPSPACVLTGKPASCPEAEFWEQEGARVAVAVLAHTLLISENWAKVQDANPKSPVEEQRLVAFGEYAGLAGSRRDNAPSINALAQARRVLDDFFTVVGTAEFLLNSACGEVESGEVPELRRELLYLDSLRVSEKQYCGTVSEARRCFSAFAEGAATASLLFGEGGKPTVDFSAAVDAESGRTIFVLQPEDNCADSMIAKAIKGAFFEAVLSSPARRERGGEMPLVLYVADEFHRFITSDEGHGEQSFFDRARSFGAGCLVATQAVSSIVHSLSVAREPAVATAVKLLLVNTGTKLIFRSTEPDVRDLLDSISPGTGPNRVTALRPPSTLRPGECYASLPDGRFERRQLKQLDLSRPTR